MALRWPLGRIIGGVVLAAALATPALARELWERSWVEVRSENFRVLSGLPAAQAREFVVELENFRRFILLVTNVGQSQSRVPTTAYLLPEYRPEFGFAPGVVGYMRPTMRSNDIVTIPSRSFLDEALKHEYVHMLVHNRDELLYPTWFDEGFAELLMTFEVKGNEIVFGRMSPIRASWLGSQEQVFPFERLLAVDSVRELRRNEMGMFYAQSWLLMHYLNFGRPEADFAAETTEYLRLTRAGTAPVAAFEKAYGIPVAELRSVLRKYSAKDLGFFRGKLPNPYVPTGLTVRDAPADLVATELGWLLLARGSAAVPAAAPYFAAAVAANPRNGRALAGLATVRDAGGDAAGAAALYERAIAADSSDPLNELDYAQYFARVAAAAQKRGDAPATAAAFVEARRHFARSYKLGPDVPETLALNGRTYLDEGARLEKGVESLAVAHELLPGNAAIRLLLARALVAKGDRAAALPHVRAVAARAHGDLGEELTRLLADLEGRATGAPKGDGSAAATPEEAPAL